MRDDFDAGSFLAGTLIGVGMYFSAIYIWPLVRPYVPAEYIPDWVAPETSFPTWSY